MVVVRVAHLLSLTGAPGTGFSAYTRLIGFDVLDRTLMADYAQPDMGGILSRALLWAGEAAAATVVVAAASLTS